MSIQRLVRWQTGRRSTATGEQQGFTLLELIITLAILSVLVGMAVPMLQHSIKRQREEELHANLQKLRHAIDHFQRYYRNGSQNPALFALESDCIDLQKHNAWPMKLECLTKGLPVPGAINGEKMYFLREIPRDPMRKCKGEDCWGMRSSFQKPEEDSWDGEHVYDVFSKSQETALNGTKYKEW
ncbi:MAG: prepilin-type N-terminal cleavage/methylation domain-containing protein [Acidobacteria bacterium]|nr:prepilin-type N-terminal cleavage/methylation domain-containing protein [Acidobacteriota bacterium]MBI3427204.1 prepilin-type N-terminal cleavage/methylation domain-containing protein [Acidobacteriota bacterium]